ncbi:MAG: hypothetical protein ABRQ24_04280 [Syntrophomonadaceae bacterium]
MAEEPKTNANVNEDRDVTEYMIDVEEYLELEPLYTPPLPGKRGKWQRP